MTKPEPPYIIRKIDFSTLNSVWIGNFAGYSNYPLNIGYGFVEWTYVDGLISRGGWNRSRLQNIVCGDKTRYDMNTNPVDYTNILTSSYPTNMNNRNYTWAGDPQVGLVLIDMYLCIFFDAGSSARGGSLEHPDLRIIANNGSSIYTNMSSYSAYGCKFKDDDGVNAWFIPFDWVWEKLSWSEEVVVSPKNPYVLEHIVHLDEIRINITWD